MQYGLDTAHAGSLGSGLAPDSDCVVETQLHRAPGAEEIRAAEAPRRWPLWLARGADVLAWVAIGWTVASVLSGCGGAPVRPTEIAICTLDGAACEAAALLRCGEKSAGWTENETSLWVLCGVMESATCVAEQLRNCAATAVKTTP